MRLHASKKTNTSVAAVIVFFAIFVGILLISQSASESEQVQKIAADFGYLGVLIIAVIAGLNAVVPVPAATFTPIFVAAGLSMPLIVITLTLGTLIADFTGFFFGRLSRELMEKKHPKIFAFFTNLKEHRRKWLFPVVALYAAFMPLPNELILIPLGLTGIRFTTLIIPLLLGNLLNQFLLVYGITYFLPGL